VRRVTCSTICFLRETFGAQSNCVWAYSARRVTCAPLPAPSERRSELGRTVFEQIVWDESHVLHYLLPPKRDIQLVRRLRSKRRIPTVYARTSHFKNSFILNALNTFQWLLFCQWLLYLLTLVTFVMLYIRCMIVVWMCTVIQLMAVSGPSCPIRRTFVYKCVHTGPVRVDTVRRLSQ